MHKILPPNGTFQKWIHKTRSGECEIFPSHNNEILPCWLFFLTQKYFYEIKLKTFQTWRDSYLKMMEEEEVFHLVFWVYFLDTKCFEYFSLWEIFILCTHFKHMWGALTAWMRKILKSFSQNILPRNSSAWRKE